MKRREFLKFGFGGLAGVALSPMLRLPSIFSSSTAYAAALTLDIAEVQHELADGRLVYARAFLDPDRTGPARIPGPVIYARAGEQITFTVRNKLAAEHGFVVLGRQNEPIPGTQQLIGPSGSAVISFSVDVPGTYLYLDHTDDPINRVLGLHGVLVVLPADADPVKNNPYGSHATPGVQKLFDDLGSKIDPAQNFFPGRPWSTAGVDWRERVWVMSEIDPVLNAEIAAGLPITPEEFRERFQPSYFTINGQSGYFSAYNPAIALMAMAGEPILIRCVSAGLDTHSPHTHANHSYILSNSNLIGRPELIGGAGNIDNIWWVDTWSMLPLDRKDVLYPMMVPPDIPPETWNKMVDFGAWHPTLNPNGSQEYWALLGPGQETHLNMAHMPAEAGQFTHLGYPMHSHQELSQVANGGNYPCGQITHIEFMGAASPDVRVWVDPEFRV